MSFAEKNLTFDLLNVVRDQRERSGAVSARTRKICLNLSHVAR